MKRRIVYIAICAIGLACVALSVFGVRAMPDYDQYILINAQSGADIYDRLSSGDAGDQPDAVSIQLQSTTDIMNTSVTIIAIDAMYSLYYPMRIVLGRGIWSEDVFAKKNVALVNEALSQKLFSTGYALGRTIAIRGNPYEVVGVIRNEVFPRASEYRLFVPLSTAGELEMAILTQSENDGIVSLSEFASRIWGSGRGALFSLASEKAKALLPVRCATFFLIMTALIAFARWTGARFVEMSAWLRGELRLRYWTNLRPELLSRILVNAALLAIAVAVAVGSVKYMLNTLSYVKEWIPYSITDVGEIARVVAKNILSGLRPAMLVSAEVNILRLWKSLGLFGLICMLLSAAGYGIIWGQRLEMGYRRIVSEQKRVRRNGI